MLNVCLIYNENTLNITNKLETLFNSDIKKKYKICNVQKFNSIDEFITSQIETVEKGIYSKLVVFVANNISIPDNIRYIYMFQELSQPNKNEDTSEKKKENYKYFQQTISGTLKKITFISSCFADQNIKSILMMPRRNFTSKILNDIFDALKFSANNKENKYLNNIQSLFYQFAENHKTPKTRSKYKNIKYLRDDKDIYFRLGNEKHGKSETNTEHNNECILGGYFRFGVRLDRNLHFNASSEDSHYIPSTCTFIDCHDKPYLIGKRVSHLNIFTNDYIR